MHKSTNKTELWQLLPVKGIANARDLGGYRVGNGKYVRKGMLLRCAHLGEATDTDIEYLESLSISCVADFRTDREKIGVVDKIIPGARYVDLPMDASGAEAAKATDKEKHIFAERKRFDMRGLIMMAAFNKSAQQVARNLYPTIFYDPGCRSQMAAFLRLVIEADGKPLLFHCTQGKDRTGIASALLLAALGADRETILNDFDITNQIYADDIRMFTERVKEAGGQQPEIDVVNSFIGANKDNLIKALDMVDAEFGSLIGYLKGPMGLSDDDINLLKDRYLTEQD